MATESRRKGIKLVIALCVIVALAVTGVLIWTSRRATVRFESEIESNIQSMSVSIGGTIEQPKDPVAKDPGYSFGGWFSDPNYLTEFDFDLPIEKDTTVYVKWVRKSFTVTILRATSGGNFYEILWSGSGKYGDTISLPGASTYMDYSWMTSTDSRQYPFRRANQTFIGFATMDNGVGNFNYTYAPDASFTIPNTSVQLYAVFRGDERNFIFKPNDGEGADKNEKGYFNEQFTVPTSEGLSKKYYTFAYWCTNADGIPRDSEGNTLPDYNDEDCVNVYLPGQTFKINSTETMTLYAIWKRNKVNIMIDARGGTNSLGTDGDNLVDAGLEGGYDLSTITQPTKDGYRLLSYNTQPDGLGMSYSVDAVLEVEEEDIELYAIWERLLTVGYTLNTSKKSDDELASAGGYEDFIGIAGESFEVKGLPVTIDIPNFQFLGWSLNSEATSADYVSGDTFVLKELDFDDNVDKIYLYGIWQGDSRVLRLKNTSDNQIQEISSYFGRLERLTTTPINVDVNYEFVGWGTVEDYNYKNPDSYTGTIYEVGSQFEMGTNTEIGQTNDILYSLWRPYSYDITYYTQGGKLAAIAEEEQTSGYYIESYVYKETITIYSQVERAGYRFMGWSYSSNSSECVYPLEGDNGYTFVMEGNPIQLYAVWQKEYTITFYNNATDSAGLVTPITGKILGETFTIPSDAVSNTITRDNYSIIGWSTKAEGGTIYDFDTEVTLESSDMISYYAVWQGDSRYIEVYNGTVQVATIEGHYGEDIPLAFDDEIENADPGQEVGGFYAMIKTSPTAENPTRYDFEYGANVKTTTLYFKDENGNAVDTLKVYIQWTNKYFSVVYELNGGTYNDDDNDDMSSYRIYKQYTTEVTLESGVPTKNRYEFKGWTENPDDDNPVLYPAGSTFTIPSHDVTLYAYWARIYSVSFSSNGGTLITDANENDLRAGSYSKGTNFIVPNTVYERTNYIFKCWNTKANGQNGVEYSVGDTLVVQNDVTLYAIWQGQEVNVTLISVDPGNAAYDTQTVKITPTPRYGDTISLGTYASTIVAPDQGLTLKGWVIDRQPTALDIDVEYTNDYTIDSVGNIEIYAVWSAKKFYLTVSLAGGIHSNSYSDVTESYAFRQKISLADYSNTIAREGYRLIGYANSATATEADYATDAEISMPNISKKIYCVWIELAIITFDKNCDDADLSNYVFEGVPYDANDGEINLTNVNKNFKRDNYTLLGWSTSSTSTSPDAGFASDNTSYVILTTQDIYLYAVWEGREIVVEFNVNGGQGAATSENLHYGDIIDLSVDKYKRTHNDEGFNFGGWSRTSGENNSSDMVSSSFAVTTGDTTTSRIRLYAVWNKRYFTLTLSYGDSSLGGKSDPDGFDSKQVQYTTDCDLTAYVGYAKKRLGYDFLGWAENRYETNASKIYGAPETIGDKDSPLTNVYFSMPNTSITLYALWQAINVDIIYTTSTPAGSTPVWEGTNGVQSYTAQELYQLSFKLPNNKITESVSVSISTYKFVGWILDGDSTQQIRAAGSWLQVNSREPLTLIAQWEENKITVVINGNSGIFEDTASTIKQLAIKENSTYTLPTSSELNRAGYRLNGFMINGQKYTDATIQITVALIAAEDEADNIIRITALWVQQFTVEFRSNGSYNDGTTGTIDNQTVDNGASIKFPNCSATEGYNRPHYKFLYWNTEADGSGVTHQAGNLFTVYASTTFYAIWEGDARTLTLNFNTNKNGQLTGSTVSVKKYTDLKYGDVLDFGNEAYTGECTDDTGFKLSGWTDIPYDASNPSAFVAKYLFGSSYTVQGEDTAPDIQLYAVWVTRSYKVTYNANGGIFADGSTTKDGPGEVSYQSNYTVENITSYNPSSTKIYYTFVGWSTDRNFSWENAGNKRPTSWEAPSTTYNYINKTSTNSEKSGFVMPNKDVVLYAIWEPVQITISIYYDIDSLNSVSVTQYVRYGGTVDLPNIEINQTLKADHNFSKWVHLDMNKTTQIAEYSNGSTIKITESVMSESECLSSSKIMIFAGTWIPQTVYVQLHGNEGYFGDVEVKTVESSVGRTFTLPKVKETNDEYQLIRVNYALVSFNTRQNGTGTLYAPGASIVIPSLTDSRITEKKITVDGTEITTHVLTLYAQWADAEAYIYLSDNEKENPYYKTLGEAISDASDGSTVRIIKDCYIKEKITVSKSVTIEVVDTDRTIYRYAGTEEDDYSTGFTGVCIDVLSTGSLNLGTNDAQYTGAWLFFDGQKDRFSSYCESFISVAGVATIYNGISFSNSWANNGGAIYVNGANASLVIKYVEFDNNQASNNGGAIAIDNASNVSIENSNFSGNISINGLGGGIYNKTALEMTASMFYKNEAVDGGAIYSDSEGTVTDRNNIYNNCYATGNGGAIYNKGKYYALTGGGTGYGGDAGGVFLLNACGTSGGAIYNDKSTESGDNMIITSCVFGQEDDEDYENANTAYSGGALYNVGKISVITTSFLYNEARGEGGAIAVSDSKAEFIIKGSTITGNRVPKGNGGAIYITNGIISIGEDGSTSSLNTITKNSVTTGKGHALYVANGTVSVYFATFSENDYYENSSFGGVVYQSGGTVTFYGGTISNNILANVDDMTVGSYGGGLFVANGTCNIRKLTINNNIAKYGGAIAITGSGSVTIVNCDIYSNTAVYGGAIYLRDQNSSININGGIIGADDIEQGNKAEGDGDSNDGLGGGIYSKGTISINGGTIKGNTSSGKGGGIYSNGIVNLVSGKISDNICAQSGGAIYADATGGGTNGSVKFKCTNSVSFIIEGNLCADGSYPLCEYEDDGAGFGNGIYAQVKVIISGYMIIGYNGDESILNDIFLSVRDTATNPSSKIVVFDSSESYSLNANTRICISSIVAVMGDKLVLFPSAGEAKAEISKFSFAGDDAGFRLDEKYLKLGNYAATIIRGGVEQYYTTLTEAYLDAQEGETIYVYKNIVLSNDLSVYEESNGLADQQEAALNGIKVSGVSIQDTFYISKKVSIVSGAEYTISRGDLTGNMFTIVGDGQLTLGEASPTSGTMLNIKGDKGVSTGSIAKVEASESFISGTLASEYQLTVYNGVKLYNNEAEKGGAIYNEGKIAIRGGEITKNLASSTEGGKGGAIYSEGADSYVYITDKASITNNTSYAGGAVYINCEDDTANALVMDSATAVISSNTASYAGGGIYMNAGIFLLTAGEISSNTSNDRAGSNPGGGGVYLGAGSTMKTSAKVTTNEANAGYIKIINNKTGSYGGGVAVDNATFNYNIGTITGNKATFGGGVAVINTSGAETATGMFVTANNSQYVNYINNNTANNGGGIAIVAGTAKLSYITMTENTATNGGAIYVGDKLIIAQTTNIGNKNTGKGNTASTSGGGIYISVDGQLELSGTLTVAFNEATAGFGGGIFNQGELTLNQTATITSNRALTGGGIANVEGHLTFEKAITLSRNTATGSEYGGGALYTTGDVDILASLTIGASTIADGNTAIRGGGIYIGAGNFTIGKSAEKVSISLTISNNSATLFGGGMYMAGGTFMDYSVGATSITNNQQTLNAGGGGGVCVSGGTFISKVHSYIDKNGTQISGNSSSWLYVESNSSAGTGGGILVNGTSESGVTFNGLRCGSSSNGNTAIRGGGVAVTSGTVRFSDPDKEGIAQTSPNPFNGNSANLGANLYLETSVYINFDVTSYYTGTGTWSGDIYLANARTYLIFSKKSESASWYPATTLNIKANDYTDGRRVAKFGSYVKVIQELGNGGEMVDVEYTTTFAEDYYTKFSCSEAGKYGIGYDDNGYVVFSEPVAYNLSRNTYHATLAQAVSAAYNNDRIKILKSHTVNDQILIINKTIVFVNSEDIILTRSPKLLGDMFRLFTTTNNTDYYVYLNYTETCSSTAFGRETYGTATLTLDGNKDNPTLKQQTLTKWGVGGTQGPYKTRGSLIGVGGGLYSVNSDGTYKPYITNASSLFGHTYVYPSYNLYLLGEKITTHTTTNSNVYPARYSLWCKNVIFKNNASAYSGGAITYKGYTNSSTLASSYIALNNCTFENNETEYYSWQSTTRGEWYSFYQSGAGGGALFLLGGRSDIQNCTFTDNISASHGGAISSIMQSNGTNYNGFYITNCTFTNNTALYGNGGAIEIVNNKGNIEWNNMYFYNNTAYTKGGAVYHTRTTKTYQDLIDEGYVYTNGHNIYPNTFTTRTAGSFTVNQVSSTGSPEAWDTYTGKNYFYLGTNCVFEGNSVGTGYCGETKTCSGEGGAIYSYHYLFVNEYSKGVRIEGNTASGNGGGIYTQYVPRLWGSSTALLNVNNNTAGGNGGGIYVAKRPGNYFGFFSCVGNVATGNGGGVYFANYGSSGYLRDVTITDNKAKNGGGVFFGYSQDNSVFNGKINNNSADERGGGIYVKGSWAYALLVSGTLEINENQAAWQGGGIYSYGSIIISGYGQVDINDNIIYGVTSDKGGGAGVWSYWEVIVCGKVNFLSNKITSPSALTNGGGGAIFAYEDEVYLTASAYYLTGGTVTGVNDLHKWVTEPNTYCQFYWRGTSSTNSESYGRGDSLTYDKDQSGWAVWGDGTWNWLPSSSGSSTVITISGNDAGYSQADGIYYWGYRLLTSGTLRIDDDIYFYRGSSKLLIDNWVAPQDTISITYPNKPSNGAVCIEAPAHVGFTSEYASRFVITNSGYYTKSTGTFGYSSQRTSTTKIQVYAGSVRVDITADTSIGETVDHGKGYVSFQVGFGDSWLTLYQKATPYREGYKYGYFYYYTNNDSTKAIHYINSSYPFPKEETLKSHFGGTLPAYVDLKVAWSANEYVIYFRKSIDNGKSGNYYVNYANDGTGWGNDSITYKISSNESMKGCIEYLETTANPLSPSNTLLYLKGWEFSHYLFSNKKKCTKDDYYPFTDNCYYFYICYVRAEYKLTFEAGDGAELLTTNNVIKVKYGSAVSMLSGNMVYKSGYKLKAWKGSDGNTYNLNTSYNTFTSNLTLEPIWEATTYQVRVYYNYPDGGTSFKVYSVYAGENLVSKLNTSQISNPMGHTLSGYATAASSAIAGYELLDSSYEMPGQDLILYAQWAPIKVTLTYYDSSQLNILHQEEVDFGTEVPLWTGAEGISLWQNRGNQTIYSAGGTFLVSNTNATYLTFVSYEISS